MHLATLQLRNSESVLEAIENASTAACKVLDAQFPGWDSGGITSNFQGLLAEVITQMLKGKSVLDETRGHPTKLPRLILDHDFFGNTNVRGEFFLVRKVSTSPHADLEPVLVLDPDTSAFGPIESVNDAYTSFQAASEAAMKYLVAEGFTIDEAEDLKLKVVPVVLAPADTPECGYVIPDLVRITDPGAIADAKLLGVGDELHMIRNAVIHSVRALNINGYKSNGEPTNAWSKSGNRDIVTPLESVLSGMKPHLSPELLVKLMLVLPSIDLPHPASRLVCHLLDKDGLLYTNHASRFPENCLYDFRIGHKTFKGMVVLDTAEYIERFQADRERWGTAPFRLSSLGPTTLELLTPTQQP